MDIYIYTNDRKQVIKLPIVPQEVMIQSPQNNYTFNTINYGDLNVIGLMGLKKVAFSSFFPSQSYHFVRNTTMSGIAYVKKLEEWRAKRQPLILFISDLNHTMKMTIDDFQYGVKDGSGDIEYSISMTEYKDLTTKAVDNKINFNINMTAYIEKMGLLKTSGINSCMIGTVGKGLKMTMFSMTIDQGLDFNYFIHQEDYGDNGVINEGGQTGTTSRNLRIEGIQINVNSIPLGYKLQYRGHVQDVGWTSWVNSGTFCGTRRQWKRLEAIEVRIVRG